MKLNVCPNYTTNNIYTQQSLHLGSLFVNAVLLSSGVKLWKIL